MAYNPVELRFAKSHEWVALDGDIESDIAVVGISKFAVDQLTDILHLELPMVGEHVEAGMPMCEIESVKAVADVYAPVSGEIIVVNATAAEKPDELVKDPYGLWLVKIRIADKAPLANLATYADYMKMVGDDS